MATLLERKAYNEFAKALRDAYAPALETLILDGEASAKRVAIGPINGAYQKVWQQTSIYSGSQMLNELIPNAGILRDPWFARVNAYLDKYAGSRIVEVHSTSVDEYLKSVRESVIRATNEGKGAVETARNIRKYAQRDLNSKIKQWQAERIARTETISAGNYGKWQGMLEAEQQGAQFVKQWLTFRDGRERPAHADADGQAREAGKMFIVGGEHLAFPGDPRGSAGNVINCRCQMRTVTDSAIE